MKTIILTNGQHVIVDDEWYPVLACHKWHLCGKGYAQRAVTAGGTVMMHQIINMTPRGWWTDHINNNKLDNRSVNLRTCTNAENSRSRVRKVGASGYRGVTKSGNRFTASIMTDYKRKGLGSFSTAEEAAKAYDKEAIKCHRNFATLNFPLETTKTFA